MYLRLFCSATSSTSSTSSSTRALKTHVHRLYKRIHPDTLHQYPEERRVNNASFQVLQSALDRYISRLNPQETSQISPPTAHNAPQRLTFFTANKSGLQKVSVQFHESRLAHSLHALFKQLELRPPPPHVLPADPHGWGTKREFATWTQLVKRARELELDAVTRKQRKAADEAAAAFKSEVSLIKLSLQRSSGAVILQGPGLPSFSHPRLLHLYKRVSALVRSYKIDMSGLIVELNGGFEVNLDTTTMHPWVTLGACATDSQWGGALSSQHLQSALHHAHQSLQHARHLESMAASKLGIRLLLHDISFHDGSNADFETFTAASEAFQKYMKLLTEIFSSDGGDLKGISAASVAVMLSQTAATQLDTEQSLLTLPLHSIDSLKDLYSLLRTHAPELHRKYDSFKKAAENERQLVCSVKRALRISSIKRAKSLQSDSIWTQTLQKLLKDARTLRGIVDGLDVEIGTTARILDNGSIEIPFDYEHSLPIK